MPMTVFNRGFTHLEHEDFSSARVPRLFETRRAAWQALRAWYALGGDYEYDECIDGPPPENRDMAIVALDLVEVQDES